MGVFHYVTVTWPLPDVFRVVKLMTAANPYGAEEVVAEFLFILCKESGQSCFVWPHPLPRPLASRLIKYTGYGRAAGLLMAHGLLSGGPSPGQSNYSSDENSDTEEYEESKPKQVYCVFESVWVLC